MIQRFLNYVEIRTKIASLLPFLLGLTYVLYAYQQINILNTLLFFTSMLSFDMATTALNNYIDVKANDKILEFSQKNAKQILYFLLFLATLLGLALVFYTGVIVLVLGALCFGVGIFYTFGPVPISRMPLGEIFSGLFMGLIIPFLVVFINAPDDSLIYFTFTNWLLQVSFNTLDLLKLGIITIPAITGIANIMLANNICDLDEDVKVNRFTLPYYTGVKNALNIFAALYYLGFVAILIMVLFGLVPIYGLIAIVGLIPIHKNISKFRKLQSKTVTFPLSVQNLVIALVPAIIVLAIGVILN
ncbi:1,4-dihydroxy-2-naphthoate polyprenyltransferase [Acetobacterium sp.]|jgi:1,4-dihydroxy-2-naphthoate octaprenyltransferase|uniref:1,4-dihydroxy-2-naphthoate polyprenyltransferase n=1 Tax=Acetobacterium sp. TaxID=1872094 RepID=UPI0027157BB0|nr:1,4-dihydroxy-2-naphthoate polyprenyltransferase [Acetobacterium sp.]MDO9493896.1 1,4-dihydroxy-2-naphthoate polyprenyltransferase [Acetobacterium sp.]